MDSIRRKLKRNHLEPPVISQVKNSAFKAGLRETAGLRMVGCDRQKEQVTT